MNDTDRTNRAKEIVTGYSAADWNKLKSILAPAVIYDEIATQRKIKGVEPMIQALQTWKQAMSDSKGTITNAFASGDTVILEVTWQGTHSGTFTGPTGTLAPTGKHQKTPAVMVVRFDGDKIHEIRHYFDMMAFLQQIGALSSVTA